MVTVEDEIKNIMRKYVEEHYGCITHELIDYMAGYDRHHNPVKLKSPITRSPTVIQGYLDELIGKKPFNKNPIIISLPDSKNRQTRHLYINDKNLFNQFDQLLTKIEKHITRWNEPISKINKLVNVEGSPYFSFNVKKTCVYPYYEPIGLMLRHLPNRLKNMKLSKKDIDMLSDRLMEIDKQFSYQILGIENLKDGLVKSKDKLVNAKSQLDSPDNNHLQNFVNSKMYDDLIQTLEDFEKQFMN